MPAEPIYVDNKLFLGRVAQQDEFRHVLREVLNEPDGEDLPYIVLLYGDGGMGKTLLARRLRDIANLEQPFEGEFHTLWIDWEDERRRNPALKVGRENISPEVVFDTIHASAVRSGWGKYFKAYQEAVKKRVETEKTVLDIVASNIDRDEFAPLRGAGASLIAKFIRLKVPEIGDTGEQFAQALLDIGIKTGAEQAAKLRALLEKSLRARLDPNQYNLFLYPNEQLAGALADGLQELSRNRPLIMFLDTYEIVDYADVWLRVTMRAAGPGLVWVVGGRDNLLESRTFGQEYFKCKKTTCGINAA